MLPPAELLLFDEDELDDDLEELELPFPSEPSTANSTATMTTAATVINTMIAVKRTALPKSYNSYP